MEDDFIDIMKGGVRKTFSEDLSEDITRTH